MSADVFDERERRILEERARHAAKPIVFADESRVTEVVRVSASGDELAILAADVRAVSALSQITPLPHAPPSVAGLAFREGRILPLFFLRAVLRLSLTALPEHGRMVVLDSPRGALGLVVDAVLGMARVKLEELIDVPHTASAEVRRVARGVDASGAVVLDTAKLLASSDLVIDIARPLRAR